jgi:hypothetical protein
MNRDCQRTRWPTTPHSSGRPSLAKSARHLPTARSTARSSAADKISPAVNLCCPTGQRLPHSLRLANIRHDSRRSTSGHRSRRRYAASRTSDRPNRAVIISTGPPEASVARRASGLRRRSKPAAEPGCIGLLAHWGSGRHFLLICDLLQR